MKPDQPIIQVTVRPTGRDQQVAWLDVSYQLSGHSWDSETVLARINQETVTIPFCPLSDLKAWDETGELPLQETEETAYPVVYTKWLTARPTRGQVGLSYRIKPRVVPDDYRSSPYFDFRNEEGGANGAGITFLAEICLEDTCSLQFAWDLTAMPPGSRGVSAYAEGDFSIEGKPERLKNAYYAVGQIKSITAGDFGFYWLAEPPFEIEVVADWTRRLFAALQRFFNDDCNLYRIFVRKDPFEKSGGGTALFRSYLFGYSEAMLPTLDSLKNMLAHELIHTWTHILDEPYGSGTWYTEGLTEYYCVVLPLRLGFATIDETLQQIQKRTDQYYTSPVRHLSNQEAAEQSWSDRRTQRIPYGRGFFFLADLDARIRKASQGHHNIDDVARSIYQCWRADQSVAAADVIRLVHERMGWDLAEEIDRMAAGVVMPPNPDSFDGLFHCEGVAATEANTGKPVQSYQWSVKRDADEQMV